MKQNLSLPPPPSAKSGWPWVEHPHSVNNQEFASFPQISIITPSYNQGQFIEETIRSVILQNYPNLEYIIIDGGSTDNTLEIIKGYENRISYWVSEPDQGQADAVNKGWEIARGSILGWLNSDDLYTPGTLQIVAETWRNHPNGLMFFGDAHSVDIELKKIDTKVMKGYTLNELLKWISMPQPAVFITPDLFRSIGKINTHLNYALDWEFFSKAWMRSDISSKFYYIDKVLALSREYKNTKMSTGKIEIADERLQILDKMWVEQLNQKEKTLKKRFAFSIGLIKQGIIYHRFNKINQAVRIYIKALMISPFTFPYMIKRVIFATIFMVNQNKNS